MESAVRSGHRVATRVGRPGWEQDQRVETDAVRRATDTE